MEGYDAERMRLREVSRALKGTDLSPEAEEAVERLSRCLVDRILRGPVSEARARLGMIAALAPAGGSGGRWCWGDGRRA